MLFEQLKINYKLYSCSFDIANSNIQCRATCDHEEMCSHFGNLNISNLSLLVRISVN